jgi:hypothetical protein
VCQPEEIERFRLALTTPRSPFGSVSAELDEPCLLGVQAERECRQTFFEIVQEALRITPVLEPDDLIIGVSHDDHVALGVARAPLLGPEIVDVMKVHIRK